ASGTGGAGSSYSLSGGALIVSNSATIGNLSAGSVTQTGGSWTITTLASPEIVGASAAGSVTLTGGSHTLFGTLTLGSGSTGIGVFNQSGGTHSVNILNIGSPATSGGSFYNLTGGSLTISNTNQSPLSLGHLNAVSRGTFSLSNNASLFVSTNEVIGEAGQ